MGLFDSVQFDPQSYNPIGGLLRRLQEWQWQNPNAQGFPPLDGNVGNALKPTIIAAPPSDNEPQRGPPLNISPPPMAMPQAQQASPLANIFGGLSNGIAANPMTLMALGSGIMQGGFGKGLQLAMAGSSLDQKNKQMQQAQNATIAALKAKGFSDAEIALAASSPEAMKAAISKIMPTYSAHNVGSTAGSFNPATGDFKPSYVEPKIEKIQPGESIIQIGGSPGGERSATPITGLPQLPAKFGDVSEMRKEIGALPEVKRVAEATPIFRSMVQSASKNSAAADLDFVYGVAKIFDPDSVVREGEMKLVGSAQSLPEDIRGYIERVAMGGGRLTPEARSRILEVAHTRINELKGGFDARVNPYADIAKRFGIRPEDVIPTVPAIPDYKPNAPISNAPSTAAIPEGATATNPKTKQRIRMQGGQWVPM